MVVASNTSPTQLERNMSFTEKSGVDNPAFQPDKTDVQRTSQNGDAKVAINLDKEEKEERAQWGNGLEFLMSCIAMSVGLGNIWRFPFTAYENGGGAFLIPYIIVLLIIGRPLYYMEMALGQFTSRGSVKMFSSFTPALRGIGYGQLLGTACVATYYCSLMALTLFYLVNSFTSDLPWSECKPEWEAENAMRNITCVASTEKGNKSSQTNTLSSSELWFTREVLHERTQIDDGVGLPEWRLTLCLLISWIVTFFVSVRGVQSSGKASYFLALFPYVIMVALLIRAVTLEGAGEGILYFIRPDWEKLATADVWYAAVTQCFFSLNVGFGSIIMYASYNDFEHNINRDAMVVTTLDTFTSLLAGTTIFGILGNLAHELNTDVDEVINSGGTGLAFISYPEAIAKFEQVPWVFAILFFTMLFVLGVGSLVALHSSVNTAITDNFPNLKNWHVSGATTIAAFLIGLVYITPGGQFILTLVDHFGGTLIIFMFAVVEICSVMWWYGVENFCDDLEFMIKQKIGIYWRIAWGIVTPVLLIVIFVYFLATLTRLSYGSYTISDLALGFGWAIVGVSLVQFAAYVLGNIYKNRDSGFPEMICDTFTPTKWGPKNNKRLEEWRKFKRQRADEVAAKGETWLQRKWHFFTGR